jgi:hypothetical protein
MFELHNLPKLEEKVILREVFRNWPANRMLEDECEAADYSLFDQNKAHTVLDLEDGTGVEYHVATNTVVRYRRTSPYTIVREFIIVEEVQ